MATRLGREGILGLFILGGLGALGASVLWLRGATFGQSSYEVVVQFKDAAGLSEGAVVRYRGSTVGTVRGVSFGDEGVTVKLRIDQPELRVPKNSLFNVNQSSFLGASSLDIVPPDVAINTATKPRDGNCDRAVILCDGAKVRGQIGVSTEALLRGTIKFTTAYSSPEFVGNLIALTKSSNAAALELAKVSKEFGLLAQTSRQELRTVSGTSVATMQNFSTTAQSLTQTSNRANLTLAQVSGLMNENRSLLVGTLDNLNQSSGSLKVAIAKMGPAIDRVTGGQLLQNLETLSANAAIASVNLRDASKAVNDPINVLMLQQTLDSARATFQNTQKLTTDLDDLMGDPKLRENLRSLINGLSKLVSSSQQVEQRANVAQQLEPLVIQAQRKELARRVGQVESLPESSPNAVLGQEQPGK
ncbi:MAG: MlaD family protein [Alkalinema sp. CAN_BIN05]|nr:MlaD family protein [Alkalinema sp. CAN_BIN05]